MKRKWYPLVMLPLIMASLFYCQNPSREDPYEIRFQKRAKMLVQHVADYYPAFNQGQRPPGYNGKLSDFGKYNYPKIIALFTHYGDTLRQWNMQLDVYAQKPTFHFNLVGLIRILHLFPDEPGVQKNELAFLNRVFERNDSYNAWTGEGTENHISMSRCSGYLYAQIALEKYPEQFPEAKKRLAQMKEWIVYFSKKVLITGTAEWNSSIYGPYNIIPWINLFDFSTDPEVKAMAKVVLDYYASELALHYSQGLNGGSDMRGKGNTKSFNGSTAYLGWLWYGDSPSPLTIQNLNMGEKNATHIAQIVHAATSQYRPHPLMRKLVKNAGMYYNSKADYLLSKPSYIKQTLFTTNSYMLGAAYLPYGGWSSGDFQIVNWKLLSRVSPGTEKSVQYLSGIGMQSPNGSFSGGHMRSPFDQLVHHKNVLMQLTSVPENVEDISSQIKVIFDQWQQDWKKDFQLRFPEDQYKVKNNPVKFQELDLSQNISSLILHPNGTWSQSEEGNILILELEKTWLLIQSIRKDKVTPFLPVMNKVDTFYSTSIGEVKGKVCGYVIEVIEKEQYLSKQDLKEKILPKIRLENSLLDNEGRLIYFSSTGDTLDIIFQPEGTFTEPLFDWGYGDSVPSHILKCPPIRQPNWPSGLGHGKLAEWKVNGQLVDLKSRWPIYSGPGVEIGVGNLYLFDEEGEYEIDFSGEKPVFKE